MRRENQEKRAGEEKNEEESRMIERRRVKSKNECNTR